MEMHLKTHRKTAAAFRHGKYLNLRRKALFTSSFVSRAISLIFSWHELSHPHDVKAISASPNPYFEYDDHGNLSPPIYLRGDEAYHWEEDERGYTLIDDPDFHPTTTAQKRKRKVYAKIDPKNGHLVSSGVRFGSSDSTVRLAGLKKHAKPWENVRRAKCGSFCETGVFPWNNETRVPINHWARASFSKVGKIRFLLDQQEERVNRRKLMFSRGTLRNLVVLIRFQDHKGRILPSPSDFEVLLNGPGGKGTVAPTGSVNDVFLSNSFGEFSLESTVYPWVTVSKPETYYAENKSGITPKIFEVRKWFFALIYS